MIWAYSIMLVRYFSMKIHETATFVMVFNVICSDNFVVKMKDLMRFEPSEQIHKNTERDFSIIWLMSGFSSDEFIQQCNE